MHHVVTFFYTCYPPEDQMGGMLTLTFLNFQTSPRSNCLVNVITPQQLPAVCREVLYIKISGNFDVNIDLCLTFLYFQTSSRSNCLVNITPHELPPVCKFFTAEYQKSLMSILTFDLLELSN